VAKKFITHPLLWIFILALFLRTYRLSEIPYGFHVDEAKAGWNAYSLLLTARDDWWHVFPLHYDSFGDQRPTGIMYASVPAVAFFGLNEFSTRFTSALFGALGVIAIFFLVKNLKLKIENFAALLAAITPWHISLSRATSEGVIASTLILFGLVFIIRKKPNYLISGILLISSYFFYHSARLLVPIFLLGVLIFKFLNTFRLPSSKQLIIFVITLSLSLSLSLSPTARSRLNQVSIFKDLGIRDELDRLPFEEGQNKVFIARLFHNKVVLYTTRFINEYAGYFSPKYFLSFGEAKPARYTTVLRGPLLYIEFFLFIFGILSIFKLKATSYKLIALFLLLSPLPAALTTEDAPNLHRALLMSPFLSIIAGLGLYHISKLHKLAYYVTLSLLTLDLIYFSHQYLVHNQARDSLTITRNGGAKELFTGALPSLVNSYRQILLTNRPDPLYIWYAFYNQPSPFAFNQGLAVSKLQDFSWEKLVFSQYKCPSEYMADNQLEQVLAVNAEGCNQFPSTTLISQVSRSGGGIPYTFWIYNPPKPTFPR
jgi:hypothetical protein